MNDLKTLRQAIGKVEIPTEMPDKLKNNKELWDETVAFPYSDPAVNMYGWPSVKSVSDYHNKQVTPPSPNSNLEPKPHIIKP